MPTSAQEELWDKLNDEVVVLYQQRKFSEAVKVAEEALKVAEKTFGLEHPNVATSLNNLGLIYQAQGKYEKAEPLYIRALEIDEKEFGKDHPDIAIDLNNLGLLCYFQGRYYEAKAFYERALKISEKALGPEHPSVKALLENIKEVNRDIRKEEEYKEIEEYADTVNELKALGDTEINEKVDVLAKKRITVKRLINKKAPIFTAVNIEGKEINLVDYKGKVVLLDFWATWCEPCIAEMPNLLKVYKKYHNKGFEIIGVSLDNSKRRLKSYLEKNNIPWVQVFDGKGWRSPLVELYKVQEIPAPFLIDREGILRQAIDIRGDRIETEVAKLLEKLNSK